MSDNSVNSVNVGGIDIVMSPAAGASLTPEQSFNRWSSEVFRNTHREFRFGDDTLVRVNSGQCYTLLLLGLERVLTPDEFNALAAKLATAYNELISEGVLSEGAIKSLATIRNYEVPDVPVEFMDEETNITAAIVGHTQIAFGKEKKPKPEEEDTADA
ncbi:MAG: hypothetical protein LBT46_15400 [Planctomycetaceae bacterium]|jgi:hypothetical protein|nr:hypothetical protein [Planctomycetaceae bacterium]